jgi:hypothetical protein
MYDNHPEVPAWLAFYLGVIVAILVMASFYISFREITSASGTFVVVEAEIEYPNDAISKCKYSLKALDGDGHVYIIMDARYAIGDTVKIVAK